ncbi:Htur_1727 family rSAM-partnered candidate RiPP [Halopelagius longus]|uniref:RSAM-partnered protein n=1 Tax=Halopelagius longus TaxID=1236180 RepID=A0A1H1C3J3_9EURY|nr:Htur_1727 family rSAM-partnered candidate RiPP [Halopelagius longus]RDI71050.1 rSAM-partnered protein [Halopelagius longus]SDQ58709.1 rSAM-partnered protein, Htur_1727 family [Halopelagius longus]
MNGDDESADANAGAGRTAPDARGTENREPRRARPDAGREWELFVREEAAGPLRHVGSVTGRTAAVAREQGESLFGWTAEAMWLCPADEVRRVGGRSLDGAAYAGDGESDGGDGRENGESREDGECRGDGNARDDAAETEVPG